jgi:hypothetical protein
MPEQILLSTVGTSDYDRTRFVLDEDSETRAALSPVALTDMLNVDEVLLAHTAEVQSGTDYLDRICETCADRGVDTNLVEVPLVAGRENVDQILDRVGAELAEADGAVVDLDITHAFRSLQLALYTTVVHLDALGVVQLDAMYYAENAGGGGTAPVLDLTYLPTLLEWHHALWDFRTAGTLGPLQELLSDKRNRIYRAGDEHPELAHLDSALGSVSSYLDAGLPLEAGVAARDAVETLQSLDDRDFVGPAGAVLDPLAEQLEPFAVEQGGVDGKGDIDLTAGELKRQREMVRFYAEHGREWVALQCARELFLNRVLYERHGSDVDWLDSDIRHEGRRVLTDAAREHRSGGESPPEAFRVWDELSQYRNKHAHAGFDSNRTPTGETVRPVIETVCERVTDETFWTGLVDGG